MTVHGDDGSADPVLALIYAVGLPGFKQRPPSAQMQSLSEYPVEAAAEADLNLIHAAGLAGFVGNTNALGHADASESEADSVLALIRAVGLSGFRASKAESAATADGGSDDPALGLINATDLQGFGGPGRTDPVAFDGSGQNFGMAWAPVRTAAPPNVTDPTQLQAMPLAATVPTSPAPSRMSRGQYVVLEISPGGEPALAALEQKMGMRFAQEGDRDGPYWMESKSAGGGSSRAFMFMGDQRSHIKDVLGNLGTPAIRLSVTEIDTSRFALAGPGSAAQAARQQKRGVTGFTPPQLPWNLGNKLSSALGR